jgi:hypothetical protein
MNKTTPTGDSSVVKLIEFKKEHVIPPPNTGNAQHLTQSY